mmetsp:Transcript_26337/g.81368  ORF Transcript_26337/g.81368 Transcript_26337/m.81368 type:complete len:211 (+) Transcript_26337:361-993(+)
MRQADLVGKHDGIRRRVPRVLVPRRARRRVHGPLFLLHPQRVRHAAHRDVHQARLLEGPGRRQADPARRAHRPLRLLRHPDSDGRRPAWHRATFPQPRVPPRQRRARRRAALLHLLLDLLRSQGNGAADAAHRGRVPLQGHYVQLRAGAEEPIVVPDLQLVRRRPVPAARGDQRAHQVRYRDGRLHVQAGPNPHHFPHQLSRVHVRAARR